MQHSESMLYGNGVLSDQKMLTVTPLKNNITGRIMTMKELAIPSRLKVTK